MRRLGIDPGSVRTGLAVADDEVPVATPLCTITHASSGEAARKVAATIAAEGIGEVVIGLPLAMDGREGQAARRARRFAGQLQGLVSVPVVLWDERLSTACAERALVAQGMRRQARRDVIDQAAATLLLQSYLDSQRDRPWPKDPLEETQDLPTPTSTAWDPRRRPR
ncbi:MAG TPA: Holliday junction resolvase RuvX [Polyangiales bacterium]